MLAHEDVLINFRFDKIKFSIINLEIIIVSNLKLKEMFNLFFMPISWTNLNIQEKSSCSFLNFNTSIFF
jgi:hypothetical protein